MLPPHPRDAPVKRVQSPSQEVGVGATGAFWGGLWGTEEVVPDTSQFSQHFRKEPLPGELMGVLSFLRGERKKNVLGIVVVTLYS